MEIEMKIRGLMMDPVTNMPIVILKDVEGKSVLPIWVGVYEANAIALEIEKVATPRPMTHDLVRNVLIGLGTGVRKVVVNELKDDTFYGVIFLERDGELISIDSRPSDALAVALRLDCPIFVDDDVLKSSKVASAVSDKASSEELRRWLENPATAALAYLWLIGAVLAGALPALALVALAAAFPAFSAARVLARSALRPAALDPAIRATIGAALMHGALLAAALLTA
jgi:bifunctional DNase/RNase